MIAGFAKLRADLTNALDISEIPADAIFSPFLEVIGSQSTTGPITFIALTAISKFLDYNVVSSKSPNIQTAVAQLSFSITHCRFEATDQAEDDAVLLKILSIMETLVCGFGTEYLNDESLCDIIETCLSMACQMRRGDLLRRSAEMTMIKLTETVFSRLYDIEATSEENTNATASTNLQEHLSNPVPEYCDQQKDQAEAAERENAPEIRTASVQTITDEVEQEYKPEESVTVDNDDTKDPAAPPDTSSRNRNISITSSNDTVHVDNKLPSNTFVSPNSAPHLDAVPPTPGDIQSFPFQRYGLPSIREYLRVLISIIDSANARQYTDATRVMVLHLINVVFEVAGTQIVKFPSLLELISESLLKHLLQLIKSENPYLLQKSLRVSCTIFHTSRSHLKLQQEMYLTYLLTCLSPISDIPREEGVDEIFYNGVPNIPRTVLNASPHPSKVGTPVGGRSSNVSSNGGPVSNLKNLASANNSSANIGSAGSNGSVVGPNGKSLPSFLTIRSPEAREMMVEALTGLTRIPSFFVDLYMNYDCDVDRADLCEDLIGFLCRNAYPDSATWSTTNVPPLCLDALLAFLSSLVYRLEYTDSSYDDTQNNDTKQHQKSKNRYIQGSLSSNLDEKKAVKNALEAKAHKRLVIHATEAFNQNPSDGIKVMVSSGLIPNEEPESVVEFLRKSGRINKKVLGEFVSKAKNAKYLDYFMKSYDFENKRLDEALRELCSDIRLPGESQLIERIVEKFAEQYCSAKSNNKYVANADAAFVLSYATIMLNTDQHSPQVKVQMTNEQFTRNLRGMNNKEDFDPEYLNSIYNAIKEKEIIIPEEHDNEESFEHVWADLISKIPKAGKAPSYNTNILDKRLFELAWKPIVSTLSYIFATATEDTVFSRVLAGFDHVAQLSTQYEVPGVIDQIIYSLGKISTLTYGDLSVPPSTIELILDDEPNSDSEQEKAVVSSSKPEKITISDLSIQFGEDFKAQLASVVLFRLAKSTGTKFISQSWSQILALVTNLYLHSLVPSTVSASQAKLGIPQLPPIRPRYKVEKSKFNKDAGLFSTLSSYLTGYNDSVPEPTDEEIEATLSTIDCVGSFDLRDFLDEALVSSPLQIVHGAIQILPNISNLPPPNKARFYPSSLYLLEFSIVASINSADAEVQRLVLECIDIYISLWEVLEKEFLTLCIVFYLVLLRQGLAELKPQLLSVLDSIANIRDVVLISCIPKLIKPLVALTEDESWTRDIVLNESKSFWKLIKLAAENRESAQSAYDFVKNLVNNNSIDKETGKATLVTPSNIVDILDVFGEIISIGACGAQLEQDKTAIAYEFRKQYDQQTAIKKAKEVIASMEMDVNRSLEALDTLKKMDSFIAEFDANGDLSTTSSTSALKDLWLPYVRTLSQQCINPSRKVRSHAFHYFQEIFISSVLHSKADFDWKMMLSEGLFPLLEALLKAEVYETDSKGMSYTRLQSASLLCKVFLQYVVRQPPSGEHNQEDIFELWIKVLDTLDRLINSTGTRRRGHADISKKSTYNYNNTHKNVQPNPNQIHSEVYNMTNVEAIESFEESVIESVKNLLLVMKSSEPPQSDYFWAETWKRIESIMPGLKEDLEMKVQSSQQVNAPPSLEKDTNQVEKEDEIVPQENNTEGSIELEKDSKVEEENIV